MCYKVTCSKCDKTSWGGCGRHVVSVYKGIESEQHCLCKDWPGVPSTDRFPPLAAKTEGASPFAATTDEVDPMSNLRKTN
ncbi:putative Branched-chain amino acid aminotransferase [Zostera marina]|uniref:Putative Branched-chain amino acid aminotransferase n=1 Tax=Zostera marina TaxID=29655 RepID=A0A0K9PPB6_ZOSMR|nr:putative Branched-chain amino acid aminotransferase [Zostera marina]